jgi:hypothetical protein
MIKSVPTIHGQNDLLAFIKILFLYLKRDRQEMMIQDAKRALMECTTTQRVHVTSMPLISCLESVMEHQVRFIVGEVYWSRSKKYFAGYKQRHHRQKVNRI